MPRSPASRPRLAGGISIVLFTGAIGGSLFFLLPDEATFEGRETSALSINYLEALLRASPDDPRLRIALGRQRLETGRLEEAYAAIQPVTRSRTELAPTARMLAAQIQLQLWRAMAADDPRREAQERAARREVDRAAADRHSPEELALLARAAAELGSLALAAAIYEGLADQDDDGAATWLGEAARWRLALGDPAMASALYDRAFDRTGDHEVALRSARAALQAAVAAGGGAAAVLLAKKYLLLLGDDPALLELALRIAAASPERPWARELSRRWLARSAGDRASVLRVVDDELAAGDLQRALEILLAYLKMHPDDADAHARAEQIAEWAGRAALALDESLWLARHGRATSIQRAIDLAIMLHDDAALVDMYLLRDRQRRLTDPDVLLVAARYEALGDPERAARFLTRHARQGDDPARLFRALAGVEERRGDLEAASEAWQEADARHPLSSTDAVEYAELVWRAGHAERALDVLWNHRDRATLRDVDLWERTADLAWELGEASRAREALAKLVEARPTDTVATERLLTLVRRAGDSAAAEALYEQLWKASKDPRYVVAQAESAEAGGRHAAALALLDAAAPQSPPLRAMDAYWTTRGDALVGMDRPREARASFEQALVQNPFSAHAASAAMWLAIDAGDLPALRAYLARFARRAPATPSLHGAFAAAYDRLDRPREALPWYARVARASPNDTSMLVSYADCLDRAGLPDRALRLRRYALTRIHPRAVKALRAGATEKDGPRLLRARALLARSLEGTTAGYAWLARAQKGSTDPELEQLAASWYVADDQVELARRWFTQADAKRLKTPAGQRLAFALAAGELPEIERALGDMTLSPQERAAADVQLGRDQEALNDVDRALAAVEAGKDHALVEEGASLSEKLGPYAKGGVSYDSFAVLDVFGPDASMFTHAGDVRLQADARQRTLLSDGRLLLASTQNELDGRVGVTFPWRRGSALAAVGINARLATAAPYVDADLAVPLVPALSAHLSGHFDEVPTDNAFLRADGLRDEIAAAIDLDAGKGRYLHVGGSVFDESTLQRHPLDVGGRASLEIGQRIWRAAPEWRFFGAGAWEGRSLGTTLPPDAAARLADPHAIPASVLPSEVVAVSLGTAISNGSLSTPLGGGLRPPRYEASAAVGWLWPLNQPMVQLRAGAGIPLFGHDQVGVVGYVLTEVSSLRGDIFRGASLVYSREL